MVGLVRGWRTWLSLLTPACFYYRLVLKYDEGKKDKVVLAATGEGDPFESIKPLLQPDQVNFAYAKIVRAQCCWDEWRLTMSSFRSMQ